MRSLLDVNVLIALLDADHASHRDAIAWFGEHARHGWASCPITENGCVRIMSHPAYPNGHSVAQVMDRLRAATSNNSHQYWADDVSILDDDVTDATMIHGQRQITSAYLLALAVKHGDRLVTFHSGIPTSAVVGAKPRHLVTL